MSTLSRSAVDTDALRSRLASIRRGALRVLFGDRLGFTVFCGTLFVLGLTLRQGVFINDNYTVGNALVAVAEGHLHLDRVAYGPGLATPGAVESGGRVYGRNYGHVFLALPVLLALRGLAVVADLRILLAGAWALLPLWTLRGVGATLGRKRLGTLLGGGFALLVFAGSVAGATALPSSWLPFLALQLVSVVAAGFVAVLCYRLVAAAYGRRIGSATGIAVVLGTGVGFWAAVPKRHALTAALALLAAFWLYRSRALADDGTGGTGGISDVGHADVRYRAGAYACVGVTAWVAAPEGAILGLAVAAADLATARRGDLEPRALLVVGVVTVVAFLPFVATNLAIAADPLQPPRRLPPYDGSMADGGGERGGQAGAGSGGSFGAVTVAGTVLGRFVRGATVAVTRPDQVFATFVRTGYTTNARSGVEAILGANLSLLESTPLFGALLGTVAVGSRRLADRLEGSASPSAPAIRVVDAFAVAYAVLLSLAYIPRLPIHATITVRYLVPMYPLLGYAVVRIPAIRRAIEHRGAWGAWTYAGTVLVGGQALFAMLALQESAVGESMQTHAVINLGLATLLAAWVVAATLAPRNGDSDRSDPSHYDTAGAVLLGLAAGAGTVLVLLASVAYFPTGGFLLPVVPAL